jgi:hypothetical protein
VRYTASHDGSLSSRCGTVKRFTLRQARARPGDLGTQARGQFHHPGQAILICRKQGRARSMAER